MNRRCAPRARVLVCVSLALAAVAGPARAQTASPSPERKPSVSGRVTGALAAGRTLTFRVDATMPGGWQGLHLVQVSIVSGGRAIEDLRFDIEDNKLTIADQRSVIVGTGSVATGNHLRISGADVVVTTGGANLSFEARTSVVETIPGDARFTLGVVDDLGASDEVTRGLAEPASRGITWETVIALIAAALFLGGLIGNLFASRRRPPIRPSIYDAVQRRLETERAAKVSEP